MFCFLSYVVMFYSWPWLCCLFFFFKQKTAYEMRISDWSSDVCSSDLGTMDTSHANALLQKHAVLDRQIREEMSRPMPDDVMIQQLKKQKLRLKEELARH